uniref:flippase n=1 Tax=Flavobacterium sp. TaxID=239 RepID=UPI0040479618
MNNYLSNTVWLFFEHGLRVLSSLLIGIWMAKYLGPYNFGVLSLALAIIAIASTVTKLGLDGVVTREIVKSPEERDVVIGTALLLKSIASFTFVCAIAVMCFIFSKAEVSLLIGILSLSLVFQALDVVDYYFMAVVKARLAAICRFISLIIGSLAKIYLILNDGSVSLFAAVITIEAAVLATLYVLMYQRKGGGLNPFLAKSRVAFSLLRDSFPLLLSGAVILLYMRIDQIMISQLLPTTQLGLYSAAIKLTEATYMIPMIVSASFFPLLQKKYADVTQYRRVLGQLYAFLSWIAVSLALLASLYAEEIVAITYGQQFSGSSDVLVISIWASVPVCIGVVFSKHLLIENRNMTFLARNAIGLSLNVAFNFMLIPIYGILGAALSTLISQIYVAFIHDVFDTRYRSELWFRIRAIFFLYPSKAVNHA